MNAPSSPTYRTLDEFYPYYLSEHSNRTCRRLHFAGTTLGLGAIVLSLATLNESTDAFLRVRELLSTNPPRETGLSLPRPDGRLSVEALTFVPPLSNKPILRGVAFGIEPGEVLGVIGGGFLFRQGARQLVGLIPVAGIVPKVAVAYAGTLAIGRAVVAWAAYGQALEPGTVRRLYRQALSHGKDVARALVAQARKRAPRRRWLRRRRG